MNIKSLLLNKYTLSFIILLACLATDILLHRGMSRVIIPSSFTEKRQPQNIKGCENNLISTSKNWVKTVDDTDVIKKLSSETAGFECDVYFDETLGHFKVYHDSTHLSQLQLDSLLAIYKYRNLTASVWLDFKNLDETNKAASLNEVKRLQKKYNLNNKIIVESGCIKCLTDYCDSGFFTSYSVPYFNPYQIEEKDLISFLDTMASNLKKYPVSALSGYYFQYPVLKKYFPNFPVLTWTDKSYVSLVSRFFNNHLENDEQIKIILYPY